ncbi:MAG: peptidoglycan editing factor PgeF [Succinivibrionaceae bacterium]
MGTVIMDKSNFLPVIFKNIDQKRIGAVCTTRKGGVSVAPFDTANYGLHVKDDPIAVNTNRKQLLDLLENVDYISWMNQTHSILVEEVNSSNLGKEINADAQYTRLKNVALAIMTADCLPVLLSSLDGEFIAVIHCGWRGLLGNIIYETIKKMQLTGDIISAWLGPCISSEVFEVGNDVYDMFCEKNKDYSKYFKLLPNVKENKYLLDLVGIAKCQLRSINVANISSIDMCTYSNKDLFFSYRRDNVTGRMVSLIWKNF